MNLWNYDISIFNITPLSAYVYFLQISYIQVKIQHTKIATCLDICPTITMEITGTTRHCFYILPSMSCKFKRNDEINTLNHYREQVNRKLFTVTTC